MYEIEKLCYPCGGEAEVFSEFVLDRCEEIVPHSNSVMFGNEYYDENDEFPLLYTNIYNNYANADDKLKGTCLVYRLQRSENVFTSALVQIIQIDFTEDEKLWKSEGVSDVRPYGNFTIDKEKSILYAFTMRDNPSSARYFAFSLPKVNSGELCEKYDVKKVLLTKDDIKEFFDCDYHHFFQGAACHGGVIYSLEGFTDNADNPPAVRVIDTKLGKEITYKQFEDFGTNIEPELIDFYNDTCLYADHNGKLYKLFF